MKGTMNDLLVRIKFQLPSLPRAEKIVAEELLENPEGNNRYDAGREWRERLGVVRHRSYASAGEWALMVIRN